MLKKTGWINSCSTGSESFTVAHKEGVFFLFYLVCCSETPCSQVCVLNKVVVNAMSPSISDARVPSAVGPCQCIEDLFYDVENVALNNAIMRQ